MYVWQYHTVPPNLNLPIVLKTPFRTKLPNLMTANISGYTVSIAALWYNKPDERRSELLLVGRVHIPNRINLIPCHTMSHYITSCHISSDSLIITRFRPL